MARTLRKHKGKKYRQKERRKLKKDKDFGPSDHKWAHKANKGPGWKGDYGHFSSMSVLYPKRIYKIKKNPPPEMNEN